LKSKTKTVILVVALGSTIWFGGLGPAEAMGLPPSLPTSIERVVPTNQNRYEQITAKIPSRKNDLLSFRSFKSNNEILLLIYLTNPCLSSNDELLKVVNKLRCGGSFIGLVGSLVFVGIVYAIFILAEGTQAFVQPPTNPGWNLPHGLYNPPGLVHPADCEKCSQLAKLLISLAVQNTEFL